jgi:hypothetical protein
MLRPGVHAPDGSANIDIHRPSLRRVTQIGGSESVAPCPSLKSLMLHGSDHNRKCPWSESTNADPVQLGYM